eukprot:SAG22_NODE_1741_length_3684_cov_1.522734_2_plen_498_part_01
MCCTTDGWLAFVWDADGSHYGVGSGLRIMVDGVTVAHSPTIARITAQLTAETGHGMQASVSRKTKAVTRQLPKKNAPLPASMVKADDEGHMTPDDVPTASLSHRNAVIAETETRWMSTVDNPNGPAMFLPLPLFGTGTRDSISPPQLSKAPASPQKQYQLPKMLRLEWTQLTSVPSSAKSAFINTTASPTGANITEYGFCRGYNGVVYAFGAVLWKVEARAWKQLSSSFPGTPRRNPALVCTNTTLFLLGGAVSIDGVTDGSVVDNWSYSLTHSTWERIRDAPTSATAVNQAAIFDDRFIILVAPAFRPPLTLGTDGFVVPSGAPIVQHLAGEALRVTNCSTVSCGAVSYRTDDPWRGNPARGTRGGATEKVCGAPMHFNDVFVFDTIGNLLGFADGLPYNVRAPRVGQDLVNGTSLFAVVGNARVLRADIVGLSNWWLTNSSTPGVAMPDLMTRDTRDFVLSPVLQGGNADLAPAPASPLPPLILKKMIGVEYSLMV